MGSSGPLVVSSARFLPPSYTSPQRRGGRDTGRGAPGSHEAMLHCEAVTFLPPGPVFAYTAVALGNGLTLRPADSGQILATLPP